MYSPFRHLPSVFRIRRPIHLTFFLTRRCNARCPFCFYLRSRDTGPAGDELSVDEIRRVSQSLGSLLWLAFSGGEVFLREDLAEISRTFYRQNRPAIMLFPTNGLLPDLIASRTEEILRSCPKSAITVKLTIDGLEDSHDRIRETPGSFRKTMETYELLGPLLARYPNFELGVNTVFCSENQDMMEEIIDFVGRLGMVRTHSISLVRGELREKRFMDVDAAKYLSAVARLEENLRRKAAGTYGFSGGRLKAAEDVLQRKLIHETLTTQRRVTPCYAGRLNLVLSEDGEVYPCEIRRESFGNVRRNGYDLTAACCSGRALEVVRSISEERCSCTHECNFITNVLFNPRWYPRLAFEYLRVSAGRGR